MSDPFLPEIQARIRQAFLLGLARVPLTAPRELAALLPADKEPALALLALSGQRQRFSAPVVADVDTVPEAARAMHADPRPNLPPFARRAFLRLTSSAEKALASSIMPRVVERIAATGHRLHPFDLPDVARHLRGHADRLGVTERAYLALTTSEADDDGAKGLFFQRITLDNWTTFPKGQRRDFLVEQRRADPEAARELLESVWKTEPASVRSMLLEALAINLGPDDAPFLGSLATDRADTVKKASALLLARVPSSAIFETRLAAAAACFSRPKGLAGIVRGLVFDGVDALTFTPPVLPGATVKSWAEREAQRTQLLAGLPLDALADAAKATPEEILAALPPGDAALLQQFIETARSTGNQSLIARILVARLTANAASPLHWLMSLAKAAHVVLPADAAARCLAAPPWRATIAEYAASNLAKDDGRLIAMALLVPREMMQAFVASIETLNAGATLAARACAELFAALPDTGAST